MSDAEEYDPKTGTFRPIARKKPAPARRPAPQRGRREPGRESLGRMEGATVTEALAQSGRGHDVAYSMFKAAFDSRSARIMEWGAKIFIVVVFLLLLWEAVSYRLTLSG